MPVPHGLLAVLRAVRGRHAVKYDLSMEEPVLEQSSPAPNAGVSSMPRWKGGLLWRCGAGTAAVRPVFFTVFDRFYGYTYYYEK